MNFGQETANRCREDDELVSETTMVECAPIDDNCITSHNNGFHNYCKNANNQINELQCEMFNLKNGHTLSHVETSQHLRTLTISLNSCNESIQTLRQSMVQPTKARLDRTRKESLPKDMIGKLTSTVNGISTSVKRLAFKSKAIEKALLGTTQRLGETLNGHAEEWKAGFQRWEDQLTLRDESAVAKIETITKALETHVEEQVLLQQRNNSLKARVDSQDSIIKTLQEKASAQDSEINNLKTSASTRDITIKELLTKIDSQDSKVREMQTKLNCIITKINLKQHKDRAQKPSPQKQRAPNARASAERPQATNTPRAVKKEARNKVDKPRASTRRTISKTATNDPFDLP